MIVIYTEWDCCQSKGVAEILSVVAVKHFWVLSRSTHDLDSQEQKLGLWY